MTGGFPGPDVGGGGGGGGRQFPNYPSTDFGLPDFLPKIFNPAGINFPVGGVIDRRDTGQFKSPIISTRLAEIARIANANIARDAARRIAAQNKEVLPVVARPPTPLPPQVRISPLPTGGGLIPTNTSTKGANNMALDLGSLLGSIAGQYIDARYSPTPQLAFNPGVQSAGYMPAVGVPFVDVIPETSGANKVWDPRANCGQGKWIRRNKRRRRRLATASDIKDLSALKSVTTGPQMNTWIATHPT